MNPSLAGAASGLIRSDPFRPASPHHTAAAFRRPEDAAVHGVKRMQLMFERILNEEFVPISYVRPYITLPPSVAMQQRGGCSFSGLC